MNYDELQTLQDVAETLKNKDDIDVTNVETLDLHFEIKFETKEKSFLLNVFTPQYNSRTIKLLTNSDRKKVLKHYNFEIGAISISESIEIEIIEWLQEKIPEPPKFDTLIGKREWWQAHDEDRAIVLENPKKCDAKTAAKKLKKEIKEMKKKF